MQNLRTFFFSQAIYLPFTYFSTSSSNGLVGSVFSSFLSNVLFSSLISFCSRSAIVKYSEHLCLKSAFCSTVKDLTKTKQYQCHLHLCYNNLSCTGSIEWVSDCCLMPIQQFFSYIMARTR